MIDKPFTIFNRPVICCDDGMAPDDFIELAEKMAWCQGVGLDISTIRLQPYSYNKFKDIRDDLSCRQINY